jgi:hypothetical protein
MHKTFNAITNDCNFLFHHYPSLCIKSKAWYVFSRTQLKQSSTNPQPRETSSHSTQYAHGLPFSRKRVRKSSMRVLSPPPNSSLITGKARTKKITKNVHVSHSSLFHDLSGVPSHSPTFPTQSPPDRTKPARKSTYSQSTPSSSPQA